jgi:SpoVK/Ycf46/Vps4 family AAA+-type ATPase
MADSVMRRQRTTAVAQKKATSAHRSKRPKATSAAVLVLHGSTALRRRKSAETLAESAETEKNLNDVFDKAEASGSILFFDEADALFGARNTVNEAHDRFANAETAYFLQRIESHNGIVILTTKGKQRIEQAFSPKTQVVVMVGTTGTGRMRKP